MNRSQKAMVAKIMSAKKDQYKKHQLIKTFAIAASGLSYDQNYKGLLDITNKMVDLVGETGAEVLTAVDGLTGIQGSKVDTRTPAEKRKATIARKKLAELAAAKDEAPEDVLNELDKQFG